MDDTHTHTPHARTHAPTRSSLLHFLIGPKRQSVRDTNRLGECVSSAAMASTLEESLGNSAKVTLQAIGAQEAALLAIAQHTYKLKEAMEAEVRPPTHTHTHTHTYKCTGRTWKP